MCYLYEIFKPQKLQNNRGKVSAGYRYTHWAEVCVQSLLKVKHNHTYSHTYTRTHIVASAFQSASRFVINNKSQMTIKKLPLSLSIDKNAAQRKTKPTRHKVIHTLYTRIHSRPHRCNTIPPVRSATGLVHVQLFWCPFASLKCLFVCFNAKI